MGIGNCTVPNFIRLPLSLRPTHFIYVNICNIDGSINQDAYVFEQFRSSSGEVLSLVGVFDGHGMLGEVASLLAAGTLHRLCVGKASLSDG